jgi:hypothetical protein
MDPSRLPMASMAMAPMLKSAFPAQSGDPRTLSDFDEDAFMAQTSLTSLSNDLADAVETARQVRCAGAWPPAARQRRRLTARMSVVHHDPRDWARRWVERHDAGMRGRIDAELGGLGSRHAIWWRCGYPA